MIISGAVIGAAVRHTGLADRLGAWLAALARGPFPRVLAVIGLFGTGLAFLMPSGMGRIFLLVPLLEAFADRAGLKIGSRGRTAVMLAGIFGTFFPAMAILPANVPNNVLAGLLETTGIGVPSFSAYLLLHFPVLGLAKLALIVGLLSIGYRDVPPVSGDKPPAPPPLSALEKRGAVVFAATIGLWLTDGWHGIPTTWVGMAAAVVCLWPGTGLMPAQPLRAVAMEPVVYVAGVVGLGALVDRSGLATAIGELIRAAIAPLAAGPVETLLLLGTIATGVGLVVTVVGTPAILTPIASILASSTGLPLHAVTMSQALGFSTVFLPYQAPPLAVSVQIGAIPFRETARYCILLSIFSMLLIWPLDALWWRLLGVLP
jgi:di/tricarboxylate transporter